MTLYEYVTPCIFFVILYGKVILAIHKKKQETGETGGKSSAMEKASSQIIKAALSVTGLFMFTIGKP